MSWDIFVQDLPPGVQAIAEIPDDFEPVPLGPRSQVIQRIREFIPAADFRDPAWGYFEGPGFSIEFNMGDPELTHSFALHVRGDDTAAAFVSDLLAYLGLRALDPQSKHGIFEDRSGPDAVRRWRAYREQVKVARRPTRACS